MSHKGSRHRIGDYEAYQRNLPQSAIRPGDTVTVKGEKCVAVRKNYMASEWVIQTPDGHSDCVPESQITKP